MKTPNLSKNSFPNSIFFLLFFISFLVHFFSSGMLGYHRDEFLYLALGNHPGLGHWSNPPFMGWVSYLSQQLFGESIRAIHVIPSIAGGLTSLLAALIAKELGGRRFAVLLAAIASIFHIAFLRAFSFLMPVPFDIFFWTLFIYLLLRYLNSKHSKYLLILGGALGLAMLNKYSVVFFAIALIISTLLTKHRAILLTKPPYSAFGIGLLVFLPNLYWQFSYGFPVIHHMQELSETQLQNVVPLDFIIDQFTMNWQNVLLVIPGLIFLLNDNKTNTHRVIGLIALSTILLFLIFKGKSYYTLGVFPPLIAAGAIFWEQKLSTNSMRIGFTSLIILLLLPILPMALPFMEASKLEEYFKTYKLDVALRWEDGELHNLPQDYADMLGWQEIADAVGKAYQLCDSQKPVILYAENYGQAGAIAHLGKKYNLPPVYSFSDSYILWHEDNPQTEVDQFIYVNDEMGEDVRALFEEIIEVGRVQDNSAREYQTTVFLCKKPKTSLREFWNSRVREMKNYRGLIEAD